MNRNVFVGIFVPIVLAFGCGDDIKKSGPVGSTNVTTANSTTANSTTANSTTANNVGFECIEHAAVALDLNGSPTQSGLVGERVTLDASETVSRSGTVERYEWSIVQAPDVSTATLSANTGQTVNFIPDIEGIYIFEMQAFAGNLPPCESTARIELGVTVVTDGLNVQLTWDTPRDPDQTDDEGTDLDLHWLNELGQWNIAPYDCFWENRFPEWGESGPLDAPELVNEDVDGQGPETIVHPEPADGRRYSAGIHYYDPNGFGPVFATIRLWENGLLIYEADEIPLSERNQFHHAFDYTVADGAIAVSRTTDGFPE